MIKEVLRDEYLVTTLLGYENRRLVECATHVKTAVCECPNRASKGASDVRTCQSSWWSVDQSARPGS
jgi:hypothetical protein